MSGAIDQPPPPASSSAAPSSPPPPPSLCYAIGQLLADYLAQAADDLRTLREATTGEAVPLEGLPQTLTGLSAPSVAPSSHAHDRRGGVQKEDAKDTEEKEEVYFSEEVRELHGKVERIEKVYETLQRATGPSGSSTAATTTGSSNSNSAASHGDAPAGPILPGPSVLPQTPNPLARQVVQGLAAIESLFHKPPRAPPSDRAARITTPTIKPLGRAVGLAEVGLHTLVQNTHTVFRKQPPSGDKRPRASEVAGQREVTADTPTPTTITTTTRQLSEQQRRERFGLYSARQPALLPRVDAALAPYGVAASPARRLFTTLNGAAEAAFLQQRWRLGTKCVLLREAPDLKELVEGYRQSLAEVDRIMADAGGAPVTPSFYFRFDSEESVSPSAPPHSQARASDSNNNGYVRINVQNGLFVDVTFDPIKRHWVVLALHWNVWQPAAAVVGYGSTHYSGAALRPLTRATAEGESGDVRLCGAVPPYFRVQPTRYAAMMEFLGRQFREGGLARGCAAATQLLCAVCLDLLAAQLEQLGLHTMHNSASDTVLGGGTSSIFSTDLRKGSYIVCRVVRPLVYEEEGLATASTTATAAKASLHLRMEVAGGTVLVERVWSSHALEKRYACLLAPSLLVRQGAEGVMASVCAERPSRSPAEGGVIVVDAEELVWRNLFSHA